MVGRIVRCRSCGKSFLTLRGSALCLSCRPKSSSDAAVIPPRLTYGGVSLLRPTTADEEQFACDIDDGGDASTVNLSKVDIGDDECNGSVDCLDDCDVSRHTIIDGERIDEYLMETTTGEVTKKRRLCTSLPSDPDDSADGCSSNNNYGGDLHPTYAPSDATVATSHRSSPLANYKHNEPEDMHEGDFHAAKRTRVEQEDNTGGTSIRVDSDINEVSKDDLVVGSTDKWRNEMGDGVIVDANNNRHHSPDDVNRDDDSDIVWLDTSPSKKEIYDLGIDDDTDAIVATLDAEIATTTTTTTTTSAPFKSEYNAHSEVNENVSVYGDEFDDSRGFNTFYYDDNDDGENTNDSCASFESRNLHDPAFDNESKPPPDTTTMHQLLPSPKKDVCYICGSDLSRLKTGFKGRVAHMKRCSAKNGGMAFRGSMTSMINDRRDDSDVEFESSDAVDQSAPTQSNESGLVNPYNNNNGTWHNDDESDFKVNDTTALRSQSKQTMLSDFLKAPVKCLTKVLMAGARQVAKKEASIKSALTSPSKAGKQSNPNSRWGTNNNRRNGSCPNYKRIPGTDFICDGFQFATKSLSENYFLTHFHSDHYGGISKNWSDGTIYCSLPTANLVHQQLRVEKKYLHPIPMNTPTSITSKGKSVIVTLFDANHCPGAVMFLFEVGNKKVLHVGDFRFNRELMMQMPQLRSFSNGSSRLDEIFLDTTYCDEKYTLPTQAEAIRAAIEVAEKEMLTSKKDKSSKTLFLFGSYTIGKERIYMSVADALKMRVYVDTRRYQILSSLEWPKERMQMFTTNKSDTSLWVVPLGSVNFKQMPDYLEEANKNKVFVAPYGRVVGFRPTGWTYKGQAKGQTTLAPSTSTKNLITSKTNGRYSIHGVPYSEHSSFPELVDCLDCLRPNKITPTVSVSKSQELVELLLNAQKKRVSRSAPSKVRHSELFSLGT